MRIPELGRIPLLRSVVAVLASAAAPWVTPADGYAQGTEIGLGIGGSMPVYETFHEHHPGPHLFAFIGSSRPRRLQLRGELSLTRLTAKTGGRETWGVNPLNVAGVHGTLVYSPSGGATGPYTFIGLGGYGVLKSPWKTVVPGLTMGLGANLELGGVGLFAQARAEVPFTPLGTNGESGAAMYLPFSAGVRLPCCGTGRRGG